MAEEQDNSERHVAAEAVVAALQTKEELPQRSKEDAKQEKHNWRRGLKRFIGKHPGLVGGLAAGLGMAACALLGSATPRRR